MIINVFFTGKYDEDRINLLVLNLDFLYLMMKAEGSE